MGVEEVAALEQANPILRDGLDNPSAVRALGRSAIVLLSSHLERFIYALFECASASICDQAIEVSRLPLMLRLEHSRLPIEDISSTSWERREAKLVNYSSTEAQMWVTGQIVTTLQSERLLRWMKSPDPKSIVRAFRIWNIEEIFSRITRLPTTHAAMRLGLTELVEKRNNIAHGDFTTEATMNDVRRYRATVGRFGRRADRAMAAAVKKITGSADWPW